MKYLIFSFLLLASLRISAQDCTDALILQKPGIWKEGMKGSVLNVHPADLAKESKVVEAIHLLVKSKYTPMGVVADWSYSYDRFEADLPVNYYNFNVLFLHYYCDKNVLKTEHETSTSLTIAINRFGNEIYTNPDENNLPTEGYYHMRKMLVEKDGVYFFEEDAGLGFGTTGKSRTWLITYDKKLPFTYVTKKEFLERQKKMLTLAMPKEIEGARAEYKARIENEFKKSLGKIETLLKMPSAESDQPAIVKQDTHENYSYLFTTNDDPFAMVLIKPNPGYFNSKLPKSSPQFITVNVFGDNNEPIAAKVMTDVVKDLDFTALKNMLGK